MVSRAAACFADLLDMVESWSAACFVYVGSIWVITRVITKPSVNIILIRQTIYSEEIERDNPSNSTK